MVNALKATFELVMGHCSERASPDAWPWCLSQKLPAPSAIRSLSNSLPRCHSP